MRADKCFSHLDSTLPNHVKDMRLRVLIVYHVVATFFEAQVVISDRHKQRAPFFPDLKLCGNPHCLVQASTIWSMPHIRHCPLRYVSSQDCQLLASGYADYFGKIHFRLLYKMAPCPN